MEFNRKDAEGLRDLKEKHGVTLVRTPDDVLIEHWKAWDKIAEEEAVKDPFFKKVLESQRAYATLVVPARRFMSSYEATGKYYWRDRQGRGAAPGVSEARAPEMGGGARRPPFGHRAAALTVRGLSRLASIRRR
jgi:hypothetical protein